MLVRSWRLAACTSTGWRRCLALEVIPGPGARGVVLQVVKIAREAAVYLREGATRRKEELLY